MQCNRNYERIDAFKCIRVLIINLIKISQNTKLFLSSMTANDEISKRMMNLSIKIHFCFAYFIRSLIA